MHQDNVGCEINLNGFVVVSNYAKFQYPNFSHVQLPSKYTIHLIISGIRHAHDDGIRSEESYRLWRVAVCDQVTSYARRLKPDRGL